MVHQIVPLLQCIKFTCCRTVAFKLAVCLCVALTLLKEEFDILENNLLF